MRVTDELLSAYQHVVTDLTIVTGGQGVFDVEVDGQLIYSKHETGRFPNEGEVLSALAALVPDGTRPYGT